MKTSFLSHPVKNINFVSGKFRQVALLVSLPVFTLVTIGNDEKQTIGGQQCVVIDSERGICESGFNSLIRKFLGGTWEFVRC